MTQSSISKMLASSATGYAVQIDGVLDIRTVTDSRQGAAKNALYLMSGGAIHVMCADPDCDCAVRFMGDQFPSARVVPVSLQVAQS